MQGFMKFVREQGVVGLAVGFILGGAVSNLVSSFVENIINPLLSVILGGVNLAAHSWEVAEATATDAAVVVEWGLVLSVLVDFLVVAAVVYFGVKKLGLDKLDK